MNTCQHCQKTFIPVNNSKGLFCSSDCFHESKFAPFILCACCHAIIGLGSKNSSKLLNKSSTTVRKNLQKKGVVPNYPEGGSWYNYARTNHGKSDDWWGNKNNEKLWMSDYKPRFFDWSYLWYKEKSIRASADKYRLMNDEQKDEHNKRSWVRRKTRCEIDAEYKRNLREQIKTWKKRNPHKVKKSVKIAKAKRKLTDPGFKVQCNLRNRLKEIMGKVKKGGTEHRNNLTGCTTKQLAKHLESQFKRGMTWDNYGRYWHVDHILPCASFDHTCHRQRAQCWHWTNLQPLEAKKNMNKSDSITEPQLSLLLCSSY